MTGVQDLTRAEAIAEYRVVGMPPEPDLEGLVQLAATLCAVPTAVINIIDDRFQHQIAAIGFTPAICSREDSMCAVVFQDPGHVVIQDARQDERFALNPFVTGDIANVRFYASSPLVTPHGVAIGTLCVFDDEVGDLTPERSDALMLLAHQVVEVLELRRLTHDLAQSNRELEMFAGRVSHDLRNPLTALTGFIELAADSPEMANAPRASRALDRADAAAHRMADMISHLLDFARISGSRPVWDDVALEDVARAIIDDLDAELVATRARILVDAPVTLRGSPTLLRALLQNLVANSVKFGHAAGVSPQVEIRAKRLSGGWRITVDDNGPGIPAQARDQVFDLMDRGSAEGVPGLGIGLSTCRRVVDAHGGRIGIADSPLGGAQVWVVLPLVMN